MSTMSHNSIAIQDAPNDENDDDYYFDDYYYDARTEDNDNHGDYVFFQSGDFGDIWKKCNQCDFTSICDMEIMINQDYHLHDGSL